MLLCAVQRVPAQPMYEPFMTALKSLGLAMARHIAQSCTRGQMMMQTATGRLNRPAVARDQTSLRSWHPAELDDALCLGVLDVGRPQSAC